MYFSFIFGLYGCPTGSVSHDYFFCLHVPPPPPYCFARITTCLLHIFWRQCSGWFSFTALPCWLCTQNSLSVGRSVPGHDPPTSYKKYTEVIIVYDRVSAIEPVWQVDFLNDSTCELGAAIRSVAWAYQESARTDSWSGMGQGCGTRALICQWPWKPKTLLMTGLIVWFYNLRVIWLFVHIRVLPCLI